ncbi:reverse transcriptase domain-containing protein [Trichonephila inaurata madagascariensis]|uniref:Reverse transcriptase domain-containing protein n=1 Tax=Trichonephila inaurata madagascariensis TaxID=2747483 RepID=A0A8X6MCL6_9ARAC|nr:reverse transcriptase domain-containing protein [Trichonephila inaurata madagascariensis]
MHRFLRMVHFYHRFIPSAKIQQSLAKMLEGHKKVLFFGQKNQKQRSKFLKMLYAKLHLVHPVSDANLSLVRDASYTAVGALIQQEVNGLKATTQFVFSVINTIPKKYSAYDRELFAIYLAVKNFKYILEG